MNDFPEGTIVIGKSNGTLFSNPPICRHCGDCHGTSKDAIALECKAVIRVEYHKTGYIKAIEYAADNPTLLEERILKSVTRMMTSAMGDGK